MRKDLFQKKEKRASGLVKAGCPCGVCAASSAWRGEDGDVVCPSFRKCGRYLRWFSETWRAVTAPFGKGKG